MDASPIQLITIALMLITDIMLTITLIAKLRDDNK